MDQAMAGTLSPDEAPAERWHFGMRALLAAALALGLLGFLFRDGIAELLHLWETKEEYSHAYLLPALSLFLFWQKKNELLARPWRGSWAAVGLCAAGLLVFFVGQLSAIFAVIHYALFITAAGVVLAYAGTRNLRYLWAGLVLLLFTVPFPQFLYQAMSTKLQLLSSELGVAVIRALGVSVYLEGNVIDLGSFKLQVIEACNGLRYLFPLASFGFLCAYLYRGPFWHKVVIFVSVAPITVFMNSLRIGIIGITVERWGQAMAEGFLHDFEGWAIFMACLAVLFAEIAILSRLQRPPASFSDSFFVEIPAPTPPGARAHDQPLPASFLACLVLVSVSCVVSLVVGNRPEITPPRSDFEEFPLQVGEWVGKREMLDKIYIDALKFTDYALINFRRDDNAAPVNFYVAYYGSQRAGESAHSPRSCIPGGGWKIEGLDTLEVPLSAAGVPLRVNRVEIGMGDNRQLVYYWFQQRGRVITNEYLVKWYLLWDALTRDRSDGALVRLTTMVPAGAEFSVGDKILQDFIASLGDKLDAFVPR
ncbi:MAG: VPLPA-CTERM-specific exosortase XrtD [Gammaproteobacteria bacterium]|nr:VPLPA-CTERM-specific exosortase XrtD [Gammaproteobacteria bacterium]